VRKLLLVALLFAGACKSRTTEVVTTPTPASTPIVTGPGAPAPRAAVEGFLGAVSAQDIQVFSGIWGDKNGPVRESKVMPRADMEQRSLYLMRCLKHDRYRVLGESPAADGERVFQVELTRGTTTRVTDFFTARGGDRWYVREVKMEPVKELCSAR
jgi:hypothetical protein